MNDVSHPGPRPPAVVMKPEYLGAAFPTRLSFMRSLVRRMSNQGWQFCRPVYELDTHGYGHAVYSVDTGKRAYSLVAFSHALNPELRNDRVIAEAWDATFNLFDGIPTQADIERLEQNTPRQEAGRYTNNELVLARANKSERLFKHVVEKLASGNQPDINLVNSVGYLMRTTAVYGSGKFGCADRAKIAEREEIQSAFQVEMLAVYLIRMFSVDLVEHIARAISDKAVALNPMTKQFLGIGNATGLGMAPFLVNHQVLLHKWVHAKELALSRVLQQSAEDKLDQFSELLKKAQKHIGDWHVDDQQQASQIEILASDCAILLDYITSQKPSFIGLHNWASENLNPETTELVISLLIETSPELVDELAENLVAKDSDDYWQPAMTVNEVQALIEEHYAWVNGHADDKTRLWYYSEEKIEPRLGTRINHPEIMAEMPIAVGPAIKQLSRQLQNNEGEATMMEFCARHPQFRHIVKRAQTTASYPYGEVAGNFCSDTFQPIDILRFKLAFFGPCKFDPKSILWTRVTMYQGAPFPEQLGEPEISWSLSVKPAQGT